jgi:hypothetical protein
MNIAGIYSIGSLAILLGYTVSLCTQKTLQTSNSGNHEIQNLSVYFSLHK